MNKKEQLMDTFKEWIEYDVDYFAVSIETKGNSGLEIIVNPFSNLQNKMEYYQNAYDDNLVLKTYDGIKIVGACGFDNDCEWETVLETLYNPFA